LREFLLRDRLLGGRLLGARQRQRPFGGLGGPRLDGLRLGHGRKRRRRRRRRLLDRRSRRRASRQERLLAPGDPLRERDDDEGVEGLADALGVVATLHDRQVLDPRERRASPTFRLGLDRGPRILHPRSMTIAAAATADVPTSVAPQWLTPSARSS